MKKSFFSTFIVLFFSFIFGFLALTTPIYAASVLQNQTPEQRVNTIDKSPSLFLDPSTLQLWNNMTQEAKVTTMTNNANLFLLTEQEIKTESATTYNPITAVQNAVKTSMDNMLSSIGKVFTTALSTTGVAILGLANLVLGLTGQFFDMILKYTVTTTTLYDSVKEPINVAWKILRDIANIAIVFSLLYLAIRTILNGNGFADTKTLAGVLVAAVLINFSLFFVTLAFNTSNFIAKSVADQIVFSGGGGSESVSANVAKMIGTKDAINKLWNQSFGQLGANGASNEWDVAFNDLRSGLLAALTMMVLVVIFAIAAILLLYRFFVFTLLMITSPFGLISTFIPWFKGMSNQWWSQLKQQFIYLPAFLLTLYIALLFIGTITSGLTPQTDTVTYFYYFFLTCGFLLMVLILPSKISGGGANMMSNFGTWSASKIRSLPKRSVQFGGRMALSGSARSMQYGAKLATGKILNSDKLKSMAQDESSKSGKFARVLMREADSLKNKTFDIRNSKLVGNAIPANWNLGKGINNWNDSVNAKAKALEERKEREKKLFGYDEKAKTEENKNAIVAAEAVRDAQGAITKQAGDDVKAAQVAYTKAIAANSGATEAEKADAKKKMEEARAKFETQTKKLEEEERKVGELRNKGDSDYLKLVQARNKRIWNKMSLTQRAAVEKMEKDMRKKWLEDGKYKAPKEKKNKNNAPTVNISGTGVRTPSATGNMGGSRSTSTGTVNFGNTGTPGSTATGTGNGTI